MAIGSAIQKGNQVYAYNERNNQILVVLGDLMGYTASTLTVKRGNFAYTYNERGIQTSARGL